MMNLFNVLSDCSFVNTSDPDVRNIATIISIVVTFVPVVIAILVIIFGMLDLGKAVAAQKEDEIKKNQGMLIKRIIVAVIVFFVVAIVKLVVGIAAGDEKKQGVIDCINFFVNNQS